MKTEVDKRTLCYNYENVMESRKWMKEIPSLKFPADWEIRIIPPFAGAVVRFLAIKNGSQVSVYLDCYDHLGFMGYPHWEIYPDSEDNNLRFEMNDTEGLINAISKSLDSMS